MRRLTRTPPGAACAPRSRLRPVRAVSQPVQLATAARCGLTVPDTLITNDADAVRQFAASPTVGKALGSPSIVEDGTRKTAFTHLLDKTDCADLTGVGTTAHQFQRWVPKDHEARVFLIGDRIFAAAIHAMTPAAHVDWRRDYRALRYEAIDPPADVITGILEYCVELELVYGAFDFVITPAGEWVFLECNPGGQYGWIEDAIGSPITEAIADLLSTGVRS